FDEDKLASAIKKSSVSKEELQWIDLILKIQELPDKEIAPANSLISLMRYSKGPNKGLQKENKKLDRKNQTLIKCTQSLGAKVQHFRIQKSKHIAEIRSLVRNSKQITDKEFRKKTSLRSTVECMRLVYEFLTGEAPQDWLATSTLRTWYQEISELQNNKQICWIKNALVFRIMVDESTRGQLKNLKDQLPNAIIVQLTNLMKCNANTISSTVIEHIQGCGLDINKCAILTTDYTLYMSMAHIDFTNWFINKLENYNNTPKQYLNDWSLVRTNNAAFNWARQSSKEIYTNQ
ncbi:31613_t:CDS:2, partial [Gigaspora margarita]